MSQAKLERASVLLSLQRALLGEVFPALHTITVEWSDTAILFVAYVDTSIREEDRESLSCVATELIADYWPIEVHYEVVAVGPGDAIKDSRTCVFARRPDVEPAGQRRLLNEDRAAARVRGLTDANVRALVDAAVAHARTRFAGSTAPTTDLDMEFFVETMIDLFSKRALNA